MNQEEREQQIRRILVAVDNSPSSLAALEAAAELAAVFGAVLVGLFVEDINLLRLTEITFVREVGLFSGQSRRLEVRRVERQFRVQASQAQEALARVARRSQVKWSFQVVRGAISTELLAAAVEADMIILGKVGWSPPARRRIGSTAQAVLTESFQHIFLLQPGLLLELPVLAVYDGAAIGQKTLVTAAQIVSARDSRLTVLIIADTEEERVRLEAEAREELQKWPQIQIRYLQQRGTPAWMLAGIVRTEGCHLLVLPGDGSLLAHEETLALLSELECPTLLIR